MKRPLIYNEREDAERVYKTGFDKGVVNWREGLALAKYFRHVMGYGDARVKSSLREFFRQHCRFYYPDRQSSRQMLRDLASKSKFQFIDNTSGVYVTEAEIETINSVQEYRNKKLLFVMLVLSKLNDGKMYVSRWKNIRETTPSRITNTEICKRAKTLTDSGFLELHGSHHRVLFINDNSPSRIWINAQNIHRLGNVFEEYFGKDMMICISCRNDCERKAYNQKRCSSCSEKEGWKARSKAYRDRRRHGTL